MIEGFIDFMTCGSNDAVRIFLEKFTAEVRASAIYDALRLKPLYAVSSIGSWAVFTTDGVPGTRFRLEPYDRGRTAPTEEQQELYRRAGWSYALTVAPAGCWLFYTADPAAVELYSDHESRVF